MNRDQMTEALKMYRAYKAGISAYERVRILGVAGTNYNPFAAAGCRVAIYSDTPMGTGSGSRIPYLTGLWGNEDEREYLYFCEVVKWLDVALDTLTTDERHVITLKWMDGLTLGQIASRTPYSERTVKTIHSRSLEKMHKPLMFIVFNTEYKPLPVA